MNATLTVWKTEITAEFEQAKADVISAQSDLQAALAVAEAAGAERRDLDDAVARISVRTPIAAAITRRHHGRIAELATTTGAVSRARGAVQGALRRVSDLEDALTQLDNILQSAPERATAEAA